MAKGDFVSKFDGDALLDELRLAKFQKLIGDLNKIPLHRKLLLDLEMDFQAFGSVNEEKFIAAERAVYEYYKNKESL